MRATAAEIKERFEALEKKVDSFDPEKSSNTSDIRGLAEEYRKIMDDYVDLLLAADLAFLLQ